MGVDESAEYQQKSLTLKPGDLIVFYTDGVTEAINEKEEEFGEDRLQKIILDNKSIPTASLMNKLLEAIETFTGEATQFDDITMLIAKRI